MIQVEPEDYLTKAVVSQLRYEGINLDKIILEYSIMDDQYKLTAILVDGTAKNLYIPKEYLMGQTAEATEETIEELIEWFKFKNTETQKEDSGKEIDIAEMML